MVTITYLKELLEYNPRTGRFIWRKRILRKGMERIDNGWNSRFANKLVKENKERNGHLHVTLHSRQYLAHKVAWAIYYDAWPTGSIDHINGNPKDNRIENLRIATMSQNLMNSKIHCDNTSGIKGVSFDRKSKTWHAYINVYYKRKNLGWFKDLDLAVEARRSAEKQYHGDFARQA